MSAIELVAYFREECGADRAEAVHVLVDLGMIEAVVDREDLPVRWIVTAKGRRALEAACDREREL
jgi:hypothetical protein